MTADRPKLLVVAGHDLLDPDGVAQSLRDRFDVRIVTPDELAKAVSSGSADFLLGAGFDFTPDENEQVTRQSAMLLHAIGEGVALFDEGASAVWANRWFAGLGPALTGRIAGVAGKAFESFANAMDDGGSAEAVGRLAKCYHIHLRKARRRYEVRVWPVLGSADGAIRVRHVAAVVRDVSARWRNQQRIDAVNRAGRKLVHLDPSAIKTLSAAERLTVLEERVIQSAHELLHFDNFAVRMLTPATGQLELVMSCGLPEPAKNVRLFASEDGNGISGYVAATGESYICPDVSQDERYVSGIDNPGSSLTVPLRLFDKVIGVFNAESNDRHAFSDADRQFAEIFANYIAMALHILNLLLVERWTTSQSATGTVTGELEEPLADLKREAQLLLDRSSDADDSSHLKRILRDVSSIRRRMKAMAGGPRSLLGVEEAIARGVEGDKELAGRRVLVVDNEPDIVKIVNDVLTARGCTVVPCGTGEEAQRYIRLESTISAEGALLLGSRPFDLVISDINLDDLTGYDVFASAKEMSADLPVILMTGFGYDPHHSIVRASQEGLQCVLFKPFQAERLVDEVKKAILGAEADATFDGSKTGSRAGQS